MARKARAPRPDDVPRRIYLMQDYTSSSLWTDEPSHGMVRLEVLPLTDATKTALEAWSERCWAWLDAEQEGHPYDDAGDREEGLRLWRVVREELPAEFDVGYATFPPSGKRVVWNPDEIPD